MSVQLLLNPETANQSWSQIYVNKQTAEHFQLTTNPVAGDVLTSDAKGNGTWQPSAVPPTAFPLLAPDGSASTPQYSFGNSPTTGLFLSSGLLAFTQAGSALTLPPSDSTAGDVVTTDGAGHLSLQPLPSSPLVFGTYTPTITGIQQASGGSGATSMYFGSGSTPGSIVVVAAKFTFTANGANPWVNISLPVPGNLTTFGQVTGLGLGVQNVATPGLGDMSVWGVQSDNINSGAVFKATVVTNPQVYACEAMFMYQIQAP
jgi:hypothetical protein